jgi:hypothetical protein
MRIPEKEGRMKKGGRKCLLKVEEKIEEKKRKIRRKGKIQSGIACGLMITKKKHKKKSFGRCTKQNPQKKKKNCFFNTNPPR